MTLFSFVNQLQFRPRMIILGTGEGNDPLFFFRRSPPLPCVLTIIPATLSSSHLRCNQSGLRHTKKVGHGKKLRHKDLWLLKMDHGTKKIENHSARTRLRFIPASKLPAPLAKSITTTSSITKRPILLYSFIFKYSKK